MAKRITLEEYQRKKNAENNKNAIDKGIKTFLIITFSCLIVLLLLLTKETTDNEELESQVNTQLKTIKKQKKDIDSLVGDKNIDYIKEKLDFYDKSVVYVIEGYGNYYYSYDCMIKKVGDKSFSYWVYNPEAAREEGYREGDC